MPGHLRKRHPQPQTSEIRQEHASLAFDASGQMHLAWLSSSASDSALAHTRWEKGQETEPQMVKATVQTFDVALVMPEKDAPKILWLDPWPGAEHPLHWAPVEEPLSPLAAWSEPQAEDRVAPRVIALSQQIPGIRRQHYLGWVSDLTIRTTPTLPSCRIHSMPG